MTTPPLLPTVWALKQPEARTATHATWAPCRLPVGTPARMMSPVGQALTDFGAAR
ncbi:MAG: hypothetical protein OXH79_05305 [Boseongicola sp.]|nr:hypothetical protein [Boseongicola sp.]